MASTHKLKPVLETLYFCVLWCTNSVFYNRRILHLPPPPIWLCLYQPSSQYDGYSEQILQYKHWTPACLVYYCISTINPRQDTKIQTPLELSLQAERKEGPANTTLSSLCEPPSLCVFCWWWWWLFLTCENFGRRFDGSLPVCAFSSQRRSACTHQFHLLRQDQSTVAQWAEMTMDECSLTSCMWACFPNVFQHYVWIA